MLMCVVLVLKFSSCCRDGIWARAEARGRLRIFSQGMERKDTILVKDIYEHTGYLDVCIRYHAY